MKVLVIASEPISADRLRAALGGATDDAEIMVVAPALHRSALRFWLSDADEAIRRAELVQRGTISGLDDAGFDAHGDTGESDPVKAVEDVLVTFPAERILIFTRASSEQRYDESIDADALQQRFGLPVQRAESKARNVERPAPRGDAHGQPSMSSRRIASARPPPGGAARSLERGLQIGLRARELWRALLDGFKQHDLLTYSSAISFQILTAVVPFAMFVLALAGLFHLNGVWRNHIAPEIRTHVSSAVFGVISSAVNKAFSGRQLLWATFGGGLALWQVSGAVRAVMGAFAQIYGANYERPFLRRHLISFALAIATGACFILAALCLVFAPFIAVRHPGAAWDVFAFLARWALAMGFLSLSVGLLVHVAPATRQPLPWVSLGTTIVTAWWVIVSVGFYFYLTALASYGSVFGSLASVIVVMAYLYISTTAFLFGAQLDAIIRAQATGTLSGVEVDASQHSYSSSVPGRERG
jgi:membrane protein